MKSIKLLLQVLLITICTYGTSFAIVEFDSSTVEIDEEEVKQCMAEWFELEDCLPNNTIQMGIDDNQIEDKLKDLEMEVKEEDFDFELKSFNSCESLENVMWKYIKDYWKANKDKWLRPMPLYRGIDMMEDSVMVESNTVMEKSADESAGVWWWADWDFSKTNTQVDWVDESDIVKTDGEYIYYYNKTEKNVYIVNAEKLEVIKKLKLPKTFNNVVLYIWDNKLTILASWYKYNASYSSYWVDRSSKTYTIVFDTTKKKSPILTKLYVADWTLSKSRKIGKYVYVLSTNYFNIPFYSFKELDDITIDSAKILPKKIDISKVGDKEKQNLKLKWKKLPYNITSWNVASCNSIEYVLPDEATMKKYDFSPAYNIISVIDTEDTSKPVKTKVIAWSNSEVYMSLDSLYLTSHMHRSYDFRCGPWLRCIMPYYHRWENTLIHRVSVDWDNLKYADSNIVPWSPLNQYSMDQHKDKFRIITSVNYPERSTGLYILNKDWLELHWMLDWIEPGEQFKSSRFMWDKLFLVTFKQIDPLFVISLSDWQNPKILWELKMPWYSTYLHPYDENHLIGLGYDTKENKWWGTMNNWVKLDLYEINYDKTVWDICVEKKADDLLKCIKETGVAEIDSLKDFFTCDSVEPCDYEKDDYVFTDTAYSIIYDNIKQSSKASNIYVTQKYTKIFWENWSYSEAINNPRMFMWKSDENKLFLPMTLYKNDKDDYYKRTDFYQWLVATQIDKDNWIKEKFRISHLDIEKAKKDRNKECLKYTAKENETKCRELIGWGTYCEPTKRQYIPKYCYKDSSIWEYMSSRNWNYRQSFVNRALWIGDNTYTIGDDMIKSSDINTWKENDRVEFEGIEK